jgi:hypothetical protein
MLNLTALNVAPGSAEMIVNTLNLVGLSETYRQLKALGWTSTGEVHPVNRTSTLTLGPALIYSLHNLGQNRTWAIEVDGQSHQVTGSAAEITAAALDLQPAKALTPAESLAADLTARYPELAKRIEAGLELYQSDTPLTYNTVWYPATDQIRCDCPDASHRRPQADFGAACKHGVKLYMKLSLSQEHQSAGLRKLTDGQERRRLASLKAPANAEDMLSKTRQQVAASGQRIAAALAVDTESLNGIYTGPASVARMRGVG